MDLQIQLKATLRDKYQRLKASHADNTLLPSRLCYQVVYFDDPLSNLSQHEFRNIDNSDLHTWLYYETVPLEDIFSCDCDHDTSQRTIITLGACGAGKTTVVQSCALDWAEGNACRDVHLLFPFTFWELNLLEGKLGLLDLVQTFYPELKELDGSSLDGYNVSFVFDGLDEFNPSLDFSCPGVSDVSEEATVDVLVTSLIRGDLLPGAHIWITTRYAAAAMIPECYLLKQTQVQGFSNEQKEQYFSAVIGSDVLANRAIDHVKISRSLHFLCQIPPICAIMASVLKNHVKADDGFKINPLSLTQIYANLVKACDPEFIARLEMLARYREEDKDVIYQDELSHRGIGLEEASLFAEEFPLVLRKDKGLNNATVFRFGHLSVQEFLAASCKLDLMAGYSPSVKCLKLVDKALQNPEGKYDVFLRFIFGLLKERGLLQPSDPLFMFVKKAILDNILSYQAVALFHCLREFDGQALLKEVKAYRKTNVSPIPGFAPMHWVLMSQRATNFEGMRDSFEMQVSTGCDEQLLRQLPAVLKSRKAMLRFCNLTDKCCPALAAVLSTRWSYLRELDLGYNSFSDSGVEELVVGLTDQSCRLKRLLLQGCGVTSQACQHLTKALTRSPKLLELDLSGNEIGDDGLKHLADGLRSPDCKLETLKLSQCNFEDKGCFHLASALQENPAHLKVLDLSINMIRDKGAAKILKKFDISQLTKLDMCHCGITALTCESIGEALKNESGTLLELNLSNNSLRDEGFARICEGMYAWSRLEKLNLSRCGITGMGCFYLAKVLCSISQLYSSGWKQKTSWQAVELKDLDLSMNFLGDAGVKEISAGLKNPYSHLKTLDLSHCGLTDECCEELATGLASKECVLGELNLSGNVIQDKGVKKLCVGLRNAECKLEKLIMRTCRLNSRSVQFLTSALKSNPAHLAELHLMGNNLEPSGIRVLTELTKNKKYALHAIDVSME